MFNSVKSDSQYEWSGCDYSDEPTQQGPLQVVLFWSQTNFGTVRLWVGWWAAHIHITLLFVYKVFKNVFRNVWTFQPKVNKFRP